MSAELRPSFLHETRHLLGPDGRPVSVIERWRPPTSSRIATRITRLDTDGHSLGETIEVSATEVAMVREPFSPEVERGIDIYRTHPLA